MSTITTSTRSARKRSILKKTAVAASTLAVGIGAVAATAVPASADFTLSDGTLHLTSGGTSATPAPPTGTWVKLPTDDGLSYFNNAASTWAGGGEFTPIPGSVTNALILGDEQPSGGIFGTPLPQFGATLPTSAPFSALTVTGSAPEFEFTGSASGPGTRTLIAGDLTGLRISYGGNTYDVSTDETSGGKHTSPLTGTITGDATTAGATITLNWTSDLDEPGFDPFRAEFQWVGTYTPAP